MNDVAKFVRRFGEFVECPKDGVAKIRYCNNCKHFKKFVDRGRWFDPIGVICEYEEESEIEGDTNECK